MANAQPLWATFYGICRTGGNRDALIINSVGTPGSRNSDVVPRCEIILSEEDRRKLVNQGIPPECSDDLSIIRARIGLDSKIELIKVLVSEELSRSYVIQQITDFLKSAKKSGGGEII